MQMKKLKKELVKFKNIWKKFFNQGGDYHVTAKYAKISHLLRINEGGRRRKFRKQKIRRSTYCTDSGMLNEIESSSWHTSSIGSATRKSNVQVTGCETGRNELDWRRARGHALFSNLETSTNSPPPLISLGREPVPAATRPCASSRLQ